MNDYGLIGTLGWIVAMLMAGVAAAIYVIKDSQLSRYKRDAKEKSRKDGPHTIGDAITALVEKRQTRKPKAKGKVIPVDVAAG